VKDLYVDCAHSARTGAPAREFYFPRSDSIVPWRQQTTACSRSVGQITLGDGQSRSEMPFSSSLRNPTS
jgi:hypothetical protein